MKKNYSPLISVIVPVYNTSEYLEKCLNTLMYQTYDNLEIICINDGSTDNSFEILKDLEKQDNRIIVYNQENNGTGYTRNKGVEYANGDYISFVDSDDWILLDLYEKFINELSLQQSDIDIFMFNAAFYFENNIDILSTFYIKEDIKDYKEHNVCTSKDINNLLLKNMFVVNKIYKKDFLTNNNITFIENKKYAEQLFNLQTLIKAKKIVVETEPLYRRRTINNKINLPSEKVFDIFEITDNIKTFLTEENLAEYYKMEFFIYSCKLFAFYYDFCPESLKFKYFNIMQEQLNNYLRTFSDKEIEYVNKIRNIVFMLNTNFIVFKQFKKQVLG